MNTRNARRWNVAWWTLIVLLAATCLKEAAAADPWRTVGLAAVTAGWFYLRDDFVGGLR